MTIAPAESCHEALQRMARNDVLSLLKRARVGEIMSAPAVTTDASADIAEAVRTMCQREVGSLPVLDGEELVGILTETNLLKEIVRSDSGCGPEVTVIVSYP